MIDPTADRAVFRQLADLLRDQISSGTLGPGDPLPSELRLAQEYGLSRTSVRQAIAILRAEALSPDLAERLKVPLTRGVVVVDVASGGPAEAAGLRRGDVISARMPTEAERRSLHLAEGVPVLVVHATDGAEAVHPADRVRLSRT